MEYTTQNLEYAVSVFYNGEQSERAKAHAWLTAAQKVPEAWNFVWELLQPTKGTEAQFYAATTLHNKILRCWNEVPPESYNELKDKLLQCVFTYSKGPKIVTNRLCISLAAFILQQGTVDLASMLRPLSTVENSALLFEVLTVIPEEYNSMTMRSALRSKNRVALQQACPAVLDDMLRCLQGVYNTDYTKEPPSEEVIQSWVTAATCACSWLTLSGEEATELMSGSLPDRMPLCRALLAVVQLICTWNPAVSDTPLDACEACLSAVRAAGGTAAAARYPTAALQLLTDISSLAAPIMERDNVPNSINEELLSALITCCVALGECHAHALVEAAESTEPLEGTSGSRKIVELVLAAQMSPGHYPVHETRSNLAFGFWYTLQDEVLNMMDRTHDIHQVWREVFISVLKALIHKSSLPTEVALSKDDHELLRCYRQDIADTVMYCYAVLGDACWSTVQEEYAAARTDSGREAALHVFGALADAAPAHDAPPALLALMQHALDTAHSTASRRMLHTALECLGGYASWVSTANVDRELGRACVRAAGAALGRCPTAAAMALRKLANDCSAPAAALAPDIVQAAQNSANRGDSWVRRQLVAAAGAALAAAEPDAAAPLLQSLADTLHNELVEQCTSAASGAAGSTQACECSAALMSALGTRPLLAKQLFCTLAPALPPYAAQPALVEPLFTILKHTVSSLIDDCLSLVSSIAQLIVTAFNTYPCAAGLDVVKLMVLALGSEWAGARALLHACVGAALATLRPDHAARPDLSEGLFATLQAITKKRPMYVDWFDDILTDLIELACSCVRQWGGGSARAACGWLGVLAGQRARELQPHAPGLTAHALHCIGGLTPRNQIEPLADLLLSLNRATWRDDSLSSWLRQALETPGFPTPHATDIHKHKFMAAVIKEKSSKRRLLETVQEFSLVCRGLVDTEYARQTMASKQLVA